MSETVAADVDAGDTQLDRARCPDAYTTPLQVRTADAGPVDLYASGASIQLLTAESRS